MAMHARPDDPRFLTIGEFGRRAQLSRKALRLYDERGLLVPARIDPDSGYRYYNRSQIARARRIRLLRLMQMPLDRLALVLDAWEMDPSTASHHIRVYLAGVEKDLEAARLAARLLEDELFPDKETTMSIPIEQHEMDSQMVVSIRRNITVPAYHQWIDPALRQLFGHIKASGAEIAGDPMALYYGPVNEEEDGPVEIAVPFNGAVLPKGEIKVRELPAHKAVTGRTHGEYNEYPKVLEIWNAVARYVDEQGLEPNWDQDMTTYELWHEDRSMTIGWPVEAFSGA